MTLNNTWEQYATPNITGLFDVMEYANTVTDGLFGTGLIMTVYFVLFLVFKRYGDEVAFGAASFITLTLTTVLWGVGLVDEILVILMAILTGASILLMWRRH